MGLIQAGSLSKFAEHERLGELLRCQLHSDLKECLFESEQGFELDHPIVRETHVHPDRVPYLNELYKQKLAASGQALKRHDWSRYLQLRERPHRLVAFIEVMHELNDRSYWKLLAHFWIDCENAWQNYAEWKDLWNSRRLQKQFAMNNEERKALAALTNKITIYRGVRNIEYTEGLS